MEPGDDTLEPGDDTLEPGDDTLEPGTKMIRPGTTVVGRGRAGGAGGCCGPTGTVAAPGLVSLHSTAPPPPDLVRVQARCTWARFRCPLEDAMSAALYK